MPNQGHIFVVDQEVQVSLSSRSRLRGKKCKVVSLTRSGSSPAYRVRDISVNGGEVLQIVQKYLVAVAPPAVTPVLGLPTAYDYRLKGDDICYVSPIARCLPGRFVRIVKGNGGPYKNNPQYTVEDLVTGEIRHPTQKVLTYVYHVFTTAQVVQPQASTPLVVAAVVQAPLHGSVNSRNLPIAVAQNVMVAFSVPQSSRVRQ